MKNDNIISRIVSFYADGFRAMTVGKKLWLLIIVKLVIFFAVLKLFFFPDVLSERYGEDDSAKASGVLERLAAPADSDIFNTK